MYSGVPTTNPVLVTFCPDSSPPTAFAMPKSTTFTRSFPPCWAIMMLSGFRSRWTIPPSCATCSASAVCRRIWVARCSVIGPDFLRISFRECPSMNSIARYINPSGVSPKS